jgi:hypothetical protein
MMWIMHYCLPAILSRLLYILMYWELIIIHSDVSGESWQLVTAIFMMKVMV